MTQSNPPLVRAVRTAKRKSNFCLVGNEDHFTLHCTHCTVLQHTALHCSVVHRFLHSFLHITLHTMHSTAAHCTALHCSVVHRFLHSFLHIALHTLHSTAAHCTALHCTHSLLHHVHQWGQGGVENYMQPMETSQLWERGSWRNLMWQIVGECMNQIWRSNQLSWCRVCRLRSTKPWTQNSQPRGHIFEDFVNQIWDLNLSCWFILNTLLNTTSVFTECFHF